MGNRIIMKNILFVTQRLGTSGLANVNITIANQLLKRGYNVAVLVMNEPQTPEKWKIDVPIIQMEGAKFNFTIQNLLGLCGKLKLNFIVRKILKYYAKKIDTVVETGGIDTVVFNENTILLTPFITEKINKVAWCHQSAHKYVGKEAVSLYLKQLQSFLIKGLACSDSVVGLTSYDRETFAKYNPNTFIIHNPVTIKHDDMEISTLEEHIISWTGRLSIDQKGIDLLAKVAAGLPEDWKVSIAGSGDVEAFNRLLKQNNAEDRVILRGTLSGSELWEHYLNSSIYLMTSRYEGFPLVLAEAMSFGLPIVAFEQNGSKEILADGEFGLLVDQGNVPQMIKVLNNLIESVEIRRCYSEKSLERVKSFSMLPIIHQWEAIL